MRLKQKFSRRDPPKSRAKVCIYNQVVPPVECKPEAAEKEAEGEGRGAGRQGHP